MTGGGEDIGNLTIGQAKLQTTSRGRGDREITFTDALRFISQVKARFKGNKDVYDSFINNMLMWGNGSKSLAEVCHEITIQFREHPDLLLEFAPFLSDFSQESRLVREAGMSKLLQPLNI